MSINKFRNLHQSGNPLLLANVWDAHSAQLAESVGCKAVGTSSHAISNSLGLEDGNNLSMDELLFFVKKIVKAVHIPVSVDIESGYAQDPSAIAQNIKTLANLGVVGINLEDSVTVNGQRTLVDANEFYNKLKSIIHILKEHNIDIFINLRTDTYVTKNPDALQETIKRGKLYKEAGVDGLFVPLIQNQADMREVIQEIGLPLNAFATKDGPNFDDCVKAGVHRISSDDAAYAKMIQLVKETYAGFNQKDLSALF